MTLYSPNDAYLVQNIERRAGVKFERVPIPQPNDLIATSITDAVAKLDTVRAKHVSTHHTSHDEYLFGVFVS